MTTATRRRVREVKVVPAPDPADKNPPRWFKVSIDDGINHPVIAGKGFPDGIAYCVLHRSKECVCVKAVIDLGFLEREPEANLPGLHDREPGEPEPEAGTPVALEWLSL
jgi:hypothetical protein